ncbi:hypothetical protein MRS44_004672 [Fusarium solani]|uniref:uncharacterized protein n=1 Tax=Fusarium solani TaxID=169388 RepID=UPI0032C3FEDA|nr:hypothetical protein MRS44_004672 [Fusarium solani]
MSLWSDTSMHPTLCLTLHSKRNDDNNQIVADSDMLTSTIDTATPFRAPGDSLDIEYSENVAAFQRIQTLRKRLQAKRRQGLYDDECLANFVDRAIYALALLIGQIQSAAATVDRKEEVACFDHQSGFSSFRYGSTFRELLASRISAWNTHFSELVSTGGSPWDFPPPTIQKLDILRMIHDHYQACAKALGGSSIQAFPTWPSHLPHPKGFLSPDWMRKTFGDRLTKPFSSLRKNRPSPLIS